MRNDWRKRILQHPGRQSSHRLGRSRGRGRCGDGNHSMGPFSRLYSTHGEGLGSSGLDGWSREGPDRLICHTIFSTASIIPSGTSVVSTTSVCSNHFREGWKAEWGGGVRGQGGRGDTYKRNINSEYHYIIRYNCLLIHALSWARYDLGYMLRCVNMSTNLGTWTWDLDWMDANSAGVEKRRWGEGERVNWRIPQLAL